MKKEYKRPILQNFGKINIVTQGADSQLTNDPGGNMGGDPMTMP